MRSFKIVSFIAAAILGITMLVFAQGGGRRDARNYNPATEVTFNGAASVSYAQGEFSVPLPTPSFSFCDGRRLFRKTPCVPRSIEPPG